MHLVKPVAESVTDMPLPSKWAANGPAEGVPAPKRGDLGDVCRELDGLTVKECELLEALVQVLHGPAGISGNVCRLICVLQQFLGDHERSLGRAARKLRDLDPHELGPPSVVVQSRLHYAEKMNRRTTASPAGRRIAR